MAKSGDAGAAPAPQPLYYQVLEELVVDGEVAFRMVSLPSVLLVARALLVAEEAAVVPATTAWLWQARCLYAHQRVLDSPVAPLHDGIFECIAKRKGRSLNLLRLHPLYYVHRCKAPSPLYPQKTGRWQHSPAAPGSGAHRNQLILDWTHGVCCTGVHACIAVHGEDGEIAPELVVADLPAQVRSGIFQNGASGAFN